MVMHMKGEEKKNTAENRDHLVTWSGPCAPHANWSRGPLNMSDEFSLQQFCCITEAKIHIF